MPSRIQHKTLSSLGGSIPLTLGWDPPAWPSTLVSPGRTPRCPPERVSASQSGAGCPGLPLALARKALRLFHRDGFHTLFRELLAVRERRAAEGRKFENSVLLLLAWTGQGPLTVLLKPTCLPVPSEPNRKPKGLCTGVAKSTLFRRLCFENKCRDLVKLTDLGEFWSLLGHF